MPRLLAIAGGAALAAGVAAPLIHIPIAGTFSYLRHPRQLAAYDVGEVVMLTAGALSIALGVMNRLKFLWLTGAAALAQLIATLLSFHDTAAALIVRADRPELVDPLLMWAGAALARAHFEWGVEVVGGGAVAVLAAAGWDLRNSLTRSGRFIRAAL